MPRWIYLQTFFEANCIFWWQKTFKNKKFFVIHPLKYLGSTQFLEAFYHAKLTSIHEKKTPHVGP
jgi:hypothetical protein